MTELAYDLTEVADGVIVRPMLTTERAIDDFLADCRARGWSPSALRNYRDTLYRLANRLPVEQDVAKIMADDIRRYRASRQRQISPNTMAGEESHLATFFNWLIVSGKIKQDPMRLVARTKRIPAEALDVKRPTTRDVARMFAVAHYGAELNALAIPAYLGPRRKAIAGLRLSDYDRENRMLRFREKGRKTIWKPIPVELAVILDASIGRGEISRLHPFQPQDPYLVPPQASLRRTGERDDRVIWRLITAIAKRAGVRADVHSLRRAFAVFYAESISHEALGLQELLGHRNPATTKAYLEGYERRVAMEPVRGLSWGQAVASLNHAGRLPTTLESSPVVGAGGFEPPLADVPDEHTQGSQHQRDLLGDLLRGVRDVATEADVQAAHSHSRASE